MQTVATILWRRLDTPGHDACRLERDDVAWQLDGAAAFRHEDGRVAQLHYRVRCDRHFHTQSGTVRGWLGDASVDWVFVRTAGGWTANDVAVPGVAHCVDLDLGFTPTTNWLPIRRLQLRPGQRADAPAAWFDLNASGLSLLEQSYACVDASHFAYAAPLFDVRTELEVSTEGLVLAYPGLWRAQS